MKTYKFLIEKFGKICKVCHLNKTLNRKQVCNICEDTPLGKQIKNS